MSKYGIDVSENQGTIDWGQVKADGVSFAILRSVKKNLSTDLYFEENYRGCRENGIPVGIYKYSYALTEEEAKKEAEAVLRLLSGRSLELPVFIDVEDASQRTLPTGTLTAIIRTFLEVIEAGGYQTGIYCNLDWYRHVLDVSAFAGRDFWIARYGKNDGQPAEAYRPSVGICWQYTSKGRVDGISGNVDLNLLYKDYGSGGSEPSQNPKELYKVRVTIDNLIIRTGPGTNYSRAGGYTGVGVFTIVEEAAGQGSASGWGKLKSGRGWISLDYCSKL